MCCIGSFFVAMLDRLARDPGIDIMYLIMYTVFDRLLEILLVLSFCSGLKDYNCFSGIYRSTFYDLVLSLSSSF